jgi:hypothetical protein
LVLLEGQADVAPAAAAGVEAAVEVDEEDDDEDDDDDVDDGDDDSVEGFASVLVSAGVSFFFSPLPFGARESFR